MRSVSRGRDTPAFQSYPRSGWIAKVDFGIAASGQMPFPGVSPPFRRATIFSHFQQWQLTVRVRVSRLVVAISRSIPCNDHEWRLSEWRPLGVAALQNGGPEPISYIIKVLPYELSEHDKRARTWAHSVQETPRWCPLWSADWQHKLPPSLAFSHQCWMPPPEEVHTVTTSSPHCHNVMHTLSQHHPHTVTTSCTHMISHTSCHNIIPHCHNIIATLS